MLSLTSEANGNVSSSGQIETNLMTKLKYKKSGGYPKQIEFTLMRT